MSLDVHSHFVPDWYVDEARGAGHERPDGMPAWPSWSPEGHLEVMDRIGVERSLLSLSSPGVALGGPGAPSALARRVNEYAATLRREHPGRFGFLASLPLPDVDASLAEAAYALDELGADGVILLTNALGAYVSDASHDPLWAFLAERRCVVLLHPTSPPGWEATSFGLPRPLMEFLFDTTRVVAKLLLDGTLHRHRGVRLVVPHSGSLVTLLADRAGGFQAVMRQMLPPGHPGRAAPAVGDALDELWWDLAGTPTPAHLRPLLARAGKQQLLYGSDYCFTPAPAVAAQVELLDRSWQAVGQTEPWRTVLAENGERLLRRS